MPVGALFSSKVWNRRCGRLCGQSFPIRRQKPAGDVDSVEIVRKLATRPQATGDERHETDIKLWQPRPRLPSHVVQLLHIAGQGGLH